jgi:hypothetical protein
LINALFEPTSGDIRRWVPEKGMAHPHFTNDPIGKAFRAKIAQYLKDQVTAMPGRTGPDEVILIQQLPLHGGSFDIGQLIKLIPGE